MPPLDVHLPRAHSTSSFIVMAADADSSSTTRPSLMKTLVASTIGGWGYGVLAAILSHPLDTVKTRQQVLGSFQQRTTLSAGPTSTPPLLPSLKGLYRGILPAVSASILFRAVPFTAFETVKGFLLTPHEFEQLAAHEENTADAVDCKPTAVMVGWSWNDHPVLVSALGGAVGGLARASLEFPFETAKVRAQTGAASARGIRDFMRGFAITAVRNVTVISAFWTFMELSRDLRERVAPQAEWPRSNAFVAGGGCSVAAWAIIYPFDVIKSNVQAQQSISTRTTSTTTTSSSTSTGTTLHRMEGRGVSRDGWNL